MPGLMPEVEAAFDAVGVQCCQTLGETDVLWEREDLLVSSGASELETVRFVLSDDSDTLANTALRTVRFDWVPWKAILGNQGNDDHEGFIKELLDADGRRELSLRYVTSEHLARRMAPLMLEPPPPGCEFVLVKLLPAISILLGGDFAGHLESHFGPPHTGKKEKKEEGSAISYVRELYEGARVKLLESPGTQGLFAWSGHVAKHGQILKGATSVIAAAQYAYDRYKKSFDTWKLTAAASGASSTATPTSAATPQGPPKRGPMTMKPRTTEATSSPVAAPSVVAADCRTEAQLHEAFCASTRGQGVLVFQSKMFAGIADQHKGGQGQLLLDGIAYENQRRGREVRPIQDDLAALRLPSSLLDSRGSHIIQLFPSMEARLSRKHREVDKQSAQALLIALVQAAHAGLLPLKCLADLAHAERQDVDKCSNFDALLSVASPVSIGAKSGSMSISRAFGVSSAMVTRPLRAARMALMLPTHGALAEERKGNTRSLLTDSEDISASPSLLRSAFSVLMAPSRVLLMGALGRRGTQDIPAVVLVAPAGPIHPKRCGSRSGEPSEEDDSSTDSGDSEDVTGEEAETSLVGATVDEAFRFVQRVLPIVGLRRPQPPAQDNEKALSLRCAALLALSNVAESDFRPGYAMPALAVEPSGDVVTTGTERLAVPPEACVAAARATVTAAADNVLLSEGSPLSVAITDLLRQSHTAKTPSEKRLLVTEALVILTLRHLMMMTVRFASEAGAAVMPANMPSLPELTALAATAAILLENERASAGAAVPPVAVGRDTCRMRSLREAGVATFFLHTFQELIDCAQAVGLVQETPMLQAGGSLLEAVTLTKDAMGSDPHRERALPVPLVSSVFHGPTFLSVYQTLCPAAPITSAENVVSIPYPTAMPFGPAASQQSLPLIKGLHLMAALPFPSPSDAATTFDRIWQTAVLEATSVASSTPTHFAARVTAAFDRVSHGIAEHTLLYPLMPSALIKVPCDFSDRGRGCRGVGYSSKQRATYEADKTKTWCETCRDHFHARKQQARPITDSSDPESSWAALGGSPVRGAGAGAGAMPPSPALSHGRERGRDDDDTELGYDDESGTTVAAALAKLTVTIAAPSSARVATSSAVVGTTAGAAAAAGSTLPLSPAPAAATAAEDTEWATISSKKAKRK